MNARRLEPERLDDVGHDAEELRESLNQVAQVNRRLGGLRALHHALRPFVASAGRAPLRLLDVGTGNAALPLHLLEWSAARGAHWNVIGVDRHPEITPIAARRAAPAGRALRIVRADALELPFRNGSFDVALCTLTLHHFEDESAIRLVREMARVARRAVLVNDLERNRAAELGARLLAATLWRGNRLTRHDGPVSVRAAFTPGELREIGDRAGLQDVSVRRHVPFRLLLRGRPSGVEP